MALGTKNRKKVFVATYTNEGLKFQMVLGPLMFAKRCTKQTYLLQGLIRCGKDHLKYRGHQEKSGVIYYYCKSRMNNTPQKNCNSPYLRADQIEPIVWNTVKSILENPEEVFNNFRDESILNEERAKSIEGRLDYISSAIKKLEVAKKRITEAFKAEVMTLPELRKEKTDIELSEEKLISERDALIMKLNVQHDVSAKIDLFKETCHKFLSKINDPKIVTERLKKDIIKFVIDEVVIEGESVKIFATIPLPNKIHEWEMDKTDIPGTFNAGATLGPVNETNMARIWNNHKQTNTPLKRKVFVGLSGGVDSALSAARLLEEGYDVTGVFIETWHPDFLPCTWKDDRREAMRAAAHLGIPFRSLDLSEKYKKEVGDYFIEEYKAGRTPNPDVMCNRSIKFGGFADYARAQGADYIATGHYAQIEKVDDRLFLKKGIDASKDQSYFLWMLTKEDLAFALFPVGSMTKEQVRIEARARGLPQAQRKDSQGICFLGTIDLPEFLSHFFSLKSGEVVDPAGSVIGTHKGAALYTVGERHGFDITDKKARERPHYVLATDIKTNTVTVGDAQHILLHRELVLSSARIEKEALSGTCEGALRYHGMMNQCKVTQQNGTYFVAFNEPVSVALGQSLVLYQNDRMVGGGVVESFA